MGERQLCKLDVASSILVRSTSLFFSEFKVLHLINDLTDKFFGFLSEDPVRPNIPYVDRIGDHKDIFDKSLTRRFRFWAGKSQTWIFLRS